MSLKIAVLRALKLGDMLCFLPTMFALKKAFPDSEIHLICHQSQFPLLERYKHIIDKLIAFPGFPGMPEQHFDSDAANKFFLERQSEQYDVALQLHGSGETSNVVVDMLGAKKSYGFYREGNYCPDAETFFHYPDHLSEVERGLFLIRKLKDDAYSVHADFLLEEKDFTQLFNQFGRPARPYYCVHAGASTESKRWSKKGFAQVADYLITQGFDVVFTGSSMESELVREILSLMSYPAIDSASLNLPLGPLAALIDQSEGLVCNDTGVSHLAALLRKKSIVIFSETDPKRWSPLNQSLHKSLTRPSVDEVLRQLSPLINEHNHMELT